MAGAALLVLSSLGPGASGQDKPLSADFPEVYRVGGFGASAWAEFAERPVVRFDGTGGLYAMEANGGHVVVIDGSGALLRTIGRKGEGPGEFYLPMGLTVWPDGRFAVADLGHNAYQVFGPDGEFERFVRMGGGMDMLSGMGNLRIDTKADPTALAIIAQGAPSSVSAMAGVFNQISGADAADEAAADEAGVDDRGLERLDLRGETVVTEPILEAWRPPGGEAEEELTLADLSEPASMFGKMLGGVRWFEPALRWAVLPDGGIAYSDSTGYVVKVTDPAGRLMKILGRPLHPEPVTRRIRDTVREHELKAFDEGEGGRFGGFAATTQGEGAEGILAGMMEAAREEIENMEFFEEIPVVAAVVATWDGTLWIQRTGGEPWDGLGPIDVMRLDGEYVGTFAAGATAMPDAFGPDGLAVFVELDELDIPSIVVRRLPAEVR